MDDAVQRINHYPADRRGICFVNTHPLDSDLSGGEGYPAFEQLEPGVELSSAVISVNSYLEFQIIQHLSKAELSHCISLTFPSPSFV